MTEPPSSPYRPPSAALAESPSAFAGTGRLSIAVTFREAWSAFLRNLGPFLGVLGVMFLAMLALVSILQLVASPLARGIAFAVGYALSICVFLWGFVRFTLAAIDGRARVADLLSMTDRFWSRLGRVLLLTLGLAAAQLPSMATQIAAQLAQDRTLVQLGVLASVLWTCAVSLRFCLAPYLLVDYELSSAAALVGSWERTRGQMLRLIGLFVLAGSLGLLVVLLLGLLFIVLSQPGVAQIGIGLPIAIAAAVLLLFPVIGFSSLLLPAAFRQIVGRPEPT